MKVCRQCNQQNPDDAHFCHQCGSGLAASAITANTQDVPSPAAITSDEALWREFIGPNADQYLAQFKKFSSNGQPRFALSWNWPAFLFISFLWFLYRKMYTYALVYAVGPMISTYLTGDMTVGLVWSIMAGATANYVYYWHCREHIGEIKRSTGSDPAKLDEVLKESGGVQSYVIWIGVALYILFAITMFKMLQDGLPDGERPLEKPAKPTAASSV